MRTDAQFSVAIATKAFIQTFLIKYVNDKFLLWSSQRELFHCRNGSYIFHSYGLRVHMYYVLNE